MAAERKDTGKWIVKRDLNEPITRVSRGNATIIGTNEDTRKKDAGKKQRMPIQDLTIGSREQKTMGQVEQTSIYW